MLFSQRVWGPPSPPAATELAGLRERFGEYTLGGVTIIKQNEYSMKDVFEVSPNTLIDKTIVANVHAQGCSVGIPRCASRLAFWRASYFEFCFLGRCVAIDLLLSYAVCDGGLRDSKMDRVAQAAPPPRVHRLDVAAKRQRKIATRWARKFPT